MNIAIVGDSWARGEWGFDEKNKYTLLHPGLSFYLKEKNHNVINRGMGGGSNRSAFRFLTNLLAENNFDLIFWFKTDPLRDIADNNFIHYNMKYDEFKSKIIEQTVECYNNFNSLGVKIHAIGGAQKLDKTLIEDYPNLIPYIPCLTEWVEPDYIHPEIWSSDWLIDAIDSKRLNHEIVDNLFEEKIKQDKLMGYKKYFWPDGRHLNRVGHQLLFDKICSDFNI